MSSDHDPLSISPKNPLGRKETKKPPKPEEVKPMPVPDDEEVKNARRRSLASQRRRSGRVSTILSQNESLG